MAGGLAVYDNSCYNRLVVISYYKNFFPFDYKSLQFFGKVIHKAGILGTCFVPLSEPDPFGNQQKEKGTAWSCSDRDGGNRFER